MVKFLPFYIYKIKLIKYFLPLYLKVDPLLIKFDIFLLFLLQGFFSNLFIKKNINTLF